MAVVTIYMSDRDKTGKTFVSKKDADEHDRKLELAENLSAFLGQRLGFLDERQSEEIGFLLAEHRELLMTALKGKPDALLDADAVRGDDTQDSAAESSEVATETGQDDSVQDAASGKQAKLRAVAG